MAQDSNAIWQELMSGWQANQQEASKAMLKSFEDWNSTMSSASDIPNNPVIDIFNSISKSLMDSYASTTQLGNSQDWEKYLNQIPNGVNLSKEMKSVIESGETLLKSLTENFSSQIINNEDNEYLLKTLMDISNPNSWLKYSGDTFDISAQKLSEGTVFSGINDLDKRFAKVTDSWILLFEESKKYHSIVFTRWTGTYTKFLDEINQGDQTDLTLRTLIDKWSTLANDELLKLHRSEEFLTAQREVIRASMEYRLNEKQVAEIICESLHIPTREEVDDLHKTVTQLRRELRQLKTQVTDIENKPNRAPSKAQPKQLPGSKKRFKRKQS